MADTNNGINYSKLWYQQ